MKSMLALLLVLPAALASSTVRADDLQLSAAAGPRSPSDGTGRVAAQVELLPLGQVTVRRSGDLIQGDTASTYAVGAQLELEITHGFRLGFAPRLAPSVQLAGATSSLLELDLCLRATFAHRVTATTELFAFFAPGYSFLIPEDSETASGPVVAFGAGAAFDVSRDVYFTAELGYQLGYQSLELAGEDVDVNFDDLHVGLGLGARF
jgi:hypothetical protein